MNLPERRSWMGSSMGRVYTRMASRRSYDAEDSRGLEFGYERLGCGAIFGTQVYPRRQSRPDRRDFSLPGTVSATWLGQEGLL